MAFFKYLLMLHLALGLIVGITGCESPSDNDKPAVIDDGGGDGDGGDGDGDGDGDGTTISSEGTAESPVSITIDTVHNGTVAASDSSFYSFSVTEASDLNLTITSTEESSITVAIFSDAALTTPVYSTYSSDVATEHTFSYIQLDTAATYYLQVSNSSDTGATYTLSFGENTYYTSEGSTGSPITLDLNTTYQASIGHGGTSYYTFTVTDAGYYDIVMSNGNYSYTPYIYIYTDAGFSTPLSGYSGTSGSDVVISEAGTYYVSIYSPNERGVGFDLVAGLSSTPKSEGTLASPATFTFESAGIDLDYNFHSYYTFTVDTAGHYKINTNSPSVTAYLYSDASFSNELATGTYSSNSLVTTLLEPGTTYYLKFVPAYSSTTSASISITQLSEGSTTNPIALTLGTTRSGMTGATGTDYNSSYYSFTVPTGGNGNYTVSVQDTSSDNCNLYIYNNAAFTGLIVSEETTHSRGETNVSNLSAGTYYVKVKGSASYDATYSILALKTATGDDGTSGSPSTITVNTPFDGNVTGTTGVSYYTFAVPNDSDTKYNIWVTDASSHQYYVTLKLYSDSGFSQLVDDTHTGGYPLYLELDPSAAYLQATATSATYNMNYKVKVYEQISNEGATNAPVALTLGTDHTAKVGMSEEISKYSFYKITLDQPGDYSFTGGTSNIYNGVGRLSNIGVSSGEATSSYSPFTFSYRQEGSQEIFLRTQNVADDQNLTYTLNVSLDATATATNEGSVSSPESLTTGTNSGLKTGKSSEMAETSYYSFTPTSVDALGNKSGYYQATASNASAGTASIKSYDDAAFTSEIGSGSTTRNIPINKNAAHYVTVTESSNDMTCDLDLSRISEGNTTNPAEIISFPLSSSHVIGAKSTSDTSGESYYKYSRGSATEHNISVTNVSGVTTNNLRIYAYGDAINGSDAITNGYGSINFTDSNSTIYLKVYNYGNANASYDLNITKN